LAFGGALAGVAAVGWSLHPPTGGPWRPDLSRLRFGLWADYLSPPQWGRYFPFLHSARPPAVPGLRAWLDLPGGLLALFPFCLWALAAPLAARPFRERRDLGAFLKGMVLFHLGLASGLILCRARSGLDLFVLSPSLVLLACLGWLGLERWFRREWLGSAATWLGAAAALASGAAALLLNFRWGGGLQRGSPGIYRRLSHGFDQPSAALERGRDLGPLDLLVRFPAAPPETIEPLVTTGFSPAIDRVAVRLLAGARIQLGAAHGADAWDWGPTMPVDLAATHRLHIEMGSLFPPPAHPYFDAVAPAEKERRAKLGRLVLDGRTAFDQIRDFYPATPGSIRLGAPSPGLPVAFSGRIFSARRGIWGESAGALAAFGPVRLELTLPELPSRSGLPLISFGERGRGGVLSVRFTGPDRIRFGYDLWQAGQFESGELAALPGSTHRIAVRLPALEGPARTPEARAEAPSVALQFDGGWSWVTRVPASADASGRIYVGRNAVGATSSQGAFPGEVGIERRPLGAIPPPGPPGSVRILLRWPRGLRGHREPLVVAGSPGAGDLLGVEYLDSGHVRFTLDHWGRSFITSPAVAVNFDRIQLLEIVLPILETPSHASGEFAGRVRVALDGAEVWSAPASFFHSPSSTLTLAEDDIGGSCDPAFTGGIAAVVRGRD
ncbi:MAG TPA: hypothetical protein VHC86_06890, partial [Opitutaceae bacterium]|nr:hypothetical protein [Opitutaceae bacterium]